MPEPAIVLNYSITADEMAAFLRSVVLRQFLRRRTVIWGVVLALGIVELVSGQYLVGAFLTTLPVAIVTLLAFVTPSAAMRGAARRGDARFEPRKVTFGDLGVDEVLGPSSTHIDWSGFTRATLSQNAVLIHRGGIPLPFFIPTRAFADSAQRDEVICRLEAHGISVESK